MDNIRKHFGGSSGSRPGDGRSVFHTDVATSSHGSVSVTQNKPSPASDLNKQSKNCSESRMSTHALTVPPKTAATSPKPIPRARSVFRADPSLTPVTAGQSPLWLLAGLQAYVDGVGTLCAAATRLADEFVCHLKESSHEAMAVQFREMSQRVEAAASGEMVSLAGDVQACWQRGNAGSQDDSGMVSKSLLRLLQAQYQFFHFASEHITEFTRCQATDGAKNHVTPTSTPPPLPARSRSGALRVDASPGVQSHYRDVSKSPSSSVDSPSSLRKQISSFFSKLSPKTVTSSGEGQSVFFVGLDGEQQPQQQQSQQQLPLSQQLQQQQSQPQLSQQQPLQQQQQQLQQQPQHSQQQQLQQHQQQPQQQLSQQSDQNQQSLPFHKDQTSQTQQQNLPHEEIKPKPRTVSQQSAVEREAEEKSPMTGERLKPINDESQPDMTHATGKLPKASFPKGDACIASQEELDTVINLLSCNGSVNHPVPVRRHANISKAVGSQRTHATPDGSAACHGHRRSDSLTMTEPITNKSKTNTWPTKGFSLQDTMNQMYTYENLHPGVDYSRAGLAGWMPMEYDAAYMHGRSPWAMDGGGAQKNWPNFTGNDCNAYRGQHWSAVCDSSSCSDESSSTGDVPWMMPFDFSSPLRGGQPNAIGDRLTGPPPMTAVNPATALNGAAEKVWSSNQVWPPVPPAGSWAPDVATAPPGGQRMHHPAMSGPWNESGRVKSLWQLGAGCPLPQQSGPK